MTDFTYDLEQMKKAVEAPYHILPKGMSPDEYEVWLKSKVSKPVYVLTKEDIESDEIFKSSGYILSNG